MTNGARGILPRRSQLHHAESKDITFEEVVDLADAINQVAYVIVQMFLYLDPLVECNVLLRAVQIPFFLFLTIDKIQGRI
jgi:hypothetical protein